MPLMKIAIEPDRSGYKADYGPEAFAIQLDGGAPRVRADQLGAVASVAVQWTVDPKGYAYMMAFYRQGSAKASQPFFIDLVGIDGPDVATYTAYFVPGTYRLISNSGLTYVVGAQLWVLPNPPSESDDLQTLAGYE